MQADKAKIIQNVDRLKGGKILIVGDVGLDEYVIGQVKRISPEAPVPVLEVGQEDKRLGLASNVAANVAALGGEPWLVGVVGQDQTAEVLRTQLKANKCSSEFLIVDESRPTTKKLRVMAGQHHIVRVDFEKKKFLSSEMEKRLLNLIETLIPKCDAVLLEDYAKGMFSEKSLQRIISIAHQNKKPVTLDPHVTTPVEYYRGVDYMTPNTDEALALSQLSLDDLRAPSDSLHEVGKTLLEKLGAKAVVITRGKQGMSIFKPGGDSQGTHIPTFARNVFDVTGAGDTVIATFTLALTAGLSVEEACVISNYAAGVVVGKIGCVSATPEDLRNYIQNH